MRLNLKKIVIDFLVSNPGESFTARAMAEWILDKINNDPELLQQIVAEIGANRPEIQKQCHQIMTTETRPKQYFYSPASTDEHSGIRIEPSNKSESSEPLECDLYPKLCEFLHTEFKLYSKRIDEKRSSNRLGPDGNKWLFPDLVGMEDLSLDWHEEVRGCVNHYGDRRVRLWSFEVKRKITRGNLRNVWFQAVSNSSWANFGYLVAPDIVESGSVMKELRMLSAAHGIGLIRLNPENPAESVILIPAREKDAIDWDACSRLSEENKDFRFFLKLVRQFHQTGDPRAKDWDNIFAEVL